jgi:hypothetical protein
VIVLEQDRRLLEFACDGLGVKFDPAQSVWLASVTDEIEAVVVYTRFSQHNCEMSIATNLKKTWARRDFLRCVYRYPFAQRQMARVTAVIEEDNIPSLTMCRRLGHVEEGRLKQWFGARDGVVMRMLRSECRWL